MASLLAVAQSLVDSAPNALFKKDPTSTGGKYPDPPRTSLLANSSVKKYRAIAPRPIVPLVEVPSPSSSVDNSSQPTSPVTVVKERKGRKRASTSSASAEKRFVRDPKTFPQPCSKNFLNLGAVDKLSALDGTPLGKLLRSTPDIQVPSPSPSSSLSFDSSAANSRPFPSRYSANAFDGRAAPVSGSLEDASSRPEPVTLSLLPETPANSSILNRNSSLNPDLPKYATRDSSDPGVPTETRAPDSGPIHSNPASPAVVDSKFMDSVYGGLMCPVLLTEESGDVLWFNLALQQLMKDSASFHSLTMSSPLPVSRVHFFSSLKGGFSNAILWIVNKKESVERGDGQNTLSSLPQQLFDPQVVRLDPSSTLGVRLSGSPTATQAGSPDLSLGSSLPMSSESKVIRPSPVRLVKSVIQLQEVCPLEQLIGPIKGSFNMMKNQADQWNIPVLLTGVDFSVKWVNSCYKSIVSENGAALPADSNKPSLSLDGANRLLNGMIGGVEIRGLEQSSSYSAISSIVTIEWNKDCEDRSRKFAALAIKLEDMASKHLGYLWCLHKLPSLDH